MQPFKTLSHQEQLHRLQHLVEGVLPHYGLASAQSVLLQYEDNAVYRITPRPGEHFVLRVSAADAHSPAAQRSEMQWLMALRRETDLLVPEPIPNDVGELVTMGAVRDVPEPQPCVLLRWIPGEPPTPGIEPAIIERIGAFIAQLHQHAEQFVPPPAFVRPSWDWQRLFGTSSMLGNEEVLSSLASHQNEVLAKVATQLQHTLSLLGQNAPQWGLIHADLHRDNILLHHGAVGVIDFDDCGWGYYVLDLASVLDSFFRRVVEHPKDYLPLRDAFLRGYDSIRALPVDLDVHLRTTKVMRDMVNVNFILSSKNASVHTWGRERLDHIIAGLEEYLEGSSDLGI
ncbi:phosphotransferase enzyme family protein [Ktedonobacter racemifer]|uniref:Aminoglycoside phosphotransferase n=1 Tax=Ktedonobacter racemifer DSM 44963 TaxID=485913 RepID=D6TUJ4_KTERA|nr:phosphotransferase [Ktedonobacter racemifer]EFH84062.1 aminoglycoside phosphotransferase [Ktedonobacter racemifer DSM 44963]